MSAAFSETQTAIPDPMNNSTENQAAGPEVHPGVRSSDSLKIRCITPLRIAGRGSERTVSHPSCREKERQPSAPVELFL